MIEDRSGDPEVEALVREERIVEAAHLASERGDARTASALYERACDWGRAADEAMRAGEDARALNLAIAAKDEVLAERAVRSVASRAGAEAVATDLGRRGYDAWAARVLETAGHPLDAARAWERAGHAVRAADFFAKGGDPVHAAGVLEAALRRDPHAHMHAVALGSLLARFGRDEGAARVLQRVPVGTPERGAALAHLAGALERLGLPRAAEEAMAELVRMGDERRTAEPRLTHGEPEAPRALLFGRYEAQREVSSSPAARVIECIDVVRGERVAVKVFAERDAHGTGRDALARFEREMRALRATGHPNVVPLLDYVHEGPAIVVAWMEGGTLETMLASGPLAPARAVEIACALLSALSEAHRLGIVHRDVKPANVLFDASGVARLSDFGVAHFGDASTATADVIGTLAYMSPEQREGRPATAQSDIFAVGTLLREMLTGERPHATTSPHRLPSDAHRHLEGRHDAAVTSMAAPEVERRPADALEARANLLALAWPSEADTLRATARDAEEPENAHPNTGRLEPQPGAYALDVWTQRPIERMSLSDRPLLLPRVRAFALADHPGLQTVLRLERDAGAVWLSAPDGQALNRPLAAGERLLLEDALTVLHGAGCVHGRVDSAHVFVDGGGGAVLRLEGPEDGAATVDDDWASLDRLSLQVH
ncbi:MAG: protein kinase domain-containing protein [Polyangiaceae bacterium]|jgi:eukaryotic-like serine/threonine-protein kinase